MNEIILRKGIPGDIDGIFALVQEFAASYGPEKDKFINSFTNALNDEATFLCIAQHNDQMVGYCLGFDFYAFYSNGRVSWLEEIMVEQNFRSRGIGQKLMHEFESWCASRNSAFINTATHSATKFYESRGYKSHATYFRRKI